MKRIITNSYKESERHTLAPGKSPEERPVLKDSDVLRVFHGFREIEDAVSACLYGISGKSKVGRAYSYEADNNPLGLFVTTNPKTASEFGGTIIEFNCKVEELEAPVWPNGSYTVQGQMAEYFSGDKSKREKAREDARERARKSEYESVSKSDRPELAKTLMNFGESQALFVGDLRPNRIIRIWKRSRENGKLSAISREDFIKESKALLEPRQGTADLERSRAKNRVMSIHEPFNPEVFLDRLKSRYGRILAKEDIKKRFVDLYGSGNYEDDALMYELSRYLWPQQARNAIGWLRSEYKNNSLSVKQDSLVTKQDSLSVKQARKQASSQTNSNSQSGSPDMGMGVGKDAAVYYHDGKRVIFNFVMNGDSNERERAFLKGMSKSAIGSGKIDLRSNTGSFSCNPHLQSVVSSDGYREGARDLINRALVDINLQFPKVKIQVYE